MIPVIAVAARNTKNVMARDLLVNPSFLTRLPDACPVRFRALPDAHPG